jgi:hypothetical protein
MRKILIFLFVLIAGMSQAQVVPHNLLPPKPANAAPVVDAANVLSAKKKRRSQENWLNTITPPATRSLW